VALYQVFKLLGYIRNDTLFAADSVKSLRIVRYCAAIFAALIITLAVYIRIFHAAEDDPAGFIALSIVATLLCVVVGAGAIMFEKKLLVSIGKNREK
jgi:hypothetical protein